MFCIRAEFAFGRIVVQATCPLVTASSLSLLQISMGTPVGIIALEVAGIHQYIADDPQLCKAQDDPVAVTGVRFLLVSHPSPIFTPRPGMIKLPMALKNMSLQAMACPR